jgi:DNA-binding response OmpR family regulator
MPDSLSASILIIEDDPGIGEMLRFFFSSQGMNAAIAGDGRQGLAMIASFRPDIIILDIILPYMDGLTLLEKIRQDAIKTPVILLTEKNSVEEKLKGFDVGADDYVTKPFSLRELLARVRAILQRSEGTGARKNHRIITLKPLSINPHTREITLKDGTLVELTKTEFNVFYFLAENLNEVISHGVILENILGYDPNSQTKALVMHVANIRKKLKKKGVTSLQLQAVPGIGYKLTYYVPAD